MRSRPLAAGRLGTLVPKGKRSRAGERRAAALRTTADQTRKKGTHTHRDILDARARVAVGVASGWLSVTWMVDGAVGPAAAAVCLVVGRAVTDQHRGRVAVGCCRRRCCRSHCSPAAGERGSIGPLRLQSRDHCSLGRPLPDAGCSRRPSEIRIAPCNCASVLSLPRAAVEHAPSAAGRGGAAGCRCTRSAARHSASRLHSQRPHTGRRALQAADAAKHSAEIAAGGEREER